MSTVVLTNGDVLARNRFDTEGIEHLDLPVPVICGTQRQGDVLIVPCDPLADKGHQVPAAGVTVVRGETTGGNAHVLHTLDGECFWQPAPDAQEGLLQGWLTVEAGSAATMIHTQEHNVLGVAPGCYEIKRSREFAGEWRRIQD